MVNRRKKQLNINISPYIIKEIDAQIEDTSEFAGYSDFFTIASMELLQKLKSSDKNRQAPGGIGTLDTQHLNTISKNPMISPFPTC